MKKSEGGFTFIEIMSVLMGIILLAVVTFPMLYRFVSSININAETNKIVSEINKMRQESILTKNMSKIVFSITENTYTIYKESSGDWVQQGSIIYVENEVELNATTLPYHQLIYDGKGTPYKSSITSTKVNETEKSELIQIERIILRDNEEEVIISINPITGYLSN